MAIMARAISFFGSGNPLPRGAAWQYSQLTPKACEMTCMFAITSGPGCALAQQSIVAATKSGFMLRTSISDRFQPDLPHTRFILKPS